MNIFRGFIHFNRGLLRLRLTVKLWVLWLIVLNALISTYFMPRIEATVVFVSFMLGALAMSLLTDVYGFTRILGMGHLLWLPGLFFIVNRLPQIELNTPFGQWLVVLLVSNVLALALDGYDVWRYWQGDRTEMVQV